MKKIALFSIVAIALLLAVFGIQQVRQRAAEQARLAETERLLAETAAEAARQHASSEREKTRLQAVNSQLADKAREASQRHLALVTNRPPIAPEVSNEKSRFNEVHKDPEMKEAMRRQARQAVQKSVKQIVTTNLIQQLGLDETQTAALKDLLTRKGTLGFEFMMPLMSGEVDEAALTESGRLTKGAMIDLDAQMKSLLGEDGYKTFETHEKAQPDRDRLSRFATVLNDAGQPMTAIQQDQLLAAMAEERNQFQFTIDYGDTSKIDFEHFQDFYAEDKMNTYFEEMTRLNERLVQRARSLLSPEQTERFEELLRDQTLKSKYVVKTTNALIGKRAAK
jgi:hypothetical protein